MIKPTSIYESKSAIVHLADVQHIEKSATGIAVITQHSWWDPKTDYWANALWLPNTEQDAFIKAWRAYKEWQEEKR